ncbi:MAG TPA: TonB-dependent receptor [Kofleriaceae bacterium]
MIHPHRPLALAAAALAVVVAGAPHARAQTSTTGAVRGVVSDPGTHGPASGATIVASSPALQGTQTEFTDDTGGYYIADLPPGMYQLDVYYANAHIARDHILVQVGKLAQINLEVDSSRAGREVITIVDHAPLIDAGSMKLSVTLTPDYTRNLPAGRTSLANLDVVPTTTRDRYGIAFGGSSSFENTYIVDGLNTTTSAFQGAEWGGGNSFIGLGIPNEFVDETEVIAGAFGAEYAGTTGGLVNVVTRSGGNEVHGSVFSHVTPGGLASQARSILREGSSLSYDPHLSYRADVGGELGGPIIRDKLWFHVGFNPVIESAPIDRVVSRFRDVDGDGVPDVDPATRISLRDEVARTTIPATRRTYNFTSKLSFAASPDHQGSVSLLGTPGVRQGVMNPDWGYGPTRTIESQATEGEYAATARWTSKLFDGATQIDAQVGYVHGRDELNPRFASADAPSIRFLYARPFTDFSGYEPMPAGCIDGGANDPYPNLTNCQVANYQIGGFDHIARQTNDRISARLVGMQRLRAAGHHILKAGLEIDHDHSEITRAYTGNGIRNWDFGGSLMRVRFYSVEPGGTEPCGSDVDGDGVPDARCSFDPTGIDASAATNDLSAFVQDSWQPWPSVTINAGLRLQQQRIGMPSNMVGRVSSLSGEPAGDTAFVLDDLAPRIGALYDPTGVGRSRIYGHWGRFYEVVPLDMNISGFGNNVTDVKIIDDSTCGNLLDPKNLTCNESMPQFAGRFGGGSSIVAPGLKPQYTDELSFGAEYEVMPALKLGATFIHRSLGRVIEDVSTDGGATYVIANPGEIDGADVQALRDRARTAMAAGDAQRAASLEFQANQVEGIKRFDRPIRTYDALSLTASVHTDRTLVLASYTYSKTLGNYPGLFNPETGQPSANLTSMYDLPELMSNRYGPLQIDRPHSLKLDLYHRWPIGRADAIVLGGRARVQSGRPHSVLAGNPYGVGESYLLPRGAGERAPFESALDGHVAYHRELSKGISLEGYIDVFNLFDQQPATKLDEIWTYSNINPIVGGDATDLDHAKVVDANGEPTSTTARGVKNPNFGRPTEAAAPRSVRFGLALTF